MSTSLAGKRTGYSAQKIAGHVDAALAKRAQDGFRYSPSQRGAAAGDFVAKANRANG